MINFLNALGFLTVIKIPEKFFLKKEQFSKSLIYFPLVGLLIGIIISLFFVASSYIFPLALAVILTVGFEIVFTGGLHHDGLADMFDGVFSGEVEKNKILKIMKKSDVGVFGILVIFFVIVLKISFIYYVALANLKNLVSPIVVIAFMPAFGRWSMLYLFSRYKAAKEDSISVIFFGNTNKKIFVTSTIYLAVLFIFANTGVKVFLQNNLSLEFLYIDVDRFLLIILIMLKSILIFLFIFLFLMLISKFFTRRIGGITGDILGGICVITEVFYLFLNYLSEKFIYI